MVNRRTVLRNLAVSGTASVIGFSSGTTADTETAKGQYRNPVFEPIFADPSTIRTEDGDYYAYATMDNWGPERGGWHVVPIIRSTDLVNWEFVGDAFETVPDWYDNGTAEFVWAPDIAQYNGKYHLFYALVDFSPEYNWEHQGIGVATADSPAGPFEDQGEVLQGSAVGVGNSIDPMFYVDDGTPYLVWGSFDGIHLVELARDGNGWEYVGSPTQIASDRYEAPYVVERKGWYYLFVSSGGCCSGPDSTYQVEVGRARDLVGPYRNEQGETLMNAPGSLVIDDDQQFGAPGHNAIVKDDAGTDWLVYHAYERDEPGFVHGVPRRPLLIDPVQWRGGWPTVRTKTPSTRQRRPTDRKSDR
ncbi:arabinan endo-1,5-alpha-L-arabinosidase [halophilic archaeon]|nr:arabinan endo-1,5-alpha-L-arabinosidase [halophilic archaeon]